MKPESINVTAAVNATSEVVAAWKKANPEGVFELSNGEYTCWVREPTLNELRELASKPQDMITYNQNALDMIWLGGDIECKTDKKTFLSISAKLEKVMEIKEATIKKL